ncbi:MAG: TetR/AcrR family transcriptional regulator [Bacteroidota bacterium]
MPKSVLFDKNDVLKKVTQLFWSQGYNGTSMQDLVDVTGLNRSSIYNSFGDKFNLYEESLKYYQNKQNEKLAKYFSKDKSPKERIIVLFEETAKDITSQQSKDGCFMSNCTTELGNSNPRIHDFLVRNKDAVTTTFKNLILEAQKGKEIDSSKNANDLAAFLFSSLQGLRVTGMLENKTSDIQAIVRQTLNLL